MTSCYIVDDCITSHLENTPMAPLQSTHAPITRRHTTSRSSFSRRWVGGTSPSIRRCWQRYGMTCGHVIVAYMVILRDTFQDGSFPKSVQDCSNKCIAKLYESNLRDNIENKSIYKCRTIPRRYIVISDRVEKDLTTSIASSCHIVKLIIHPGDMHFIASSLSAFAPVLWLQMTYMTK